jgi:hypothetical protein
MLSLNLNVELIQEGSRRKSSTQSLNRNAKTKTAYPKFIPAKERLQLVGLSIIFNLNR